MTMDMNNRLTRVFGATDGTTPDENPLVRRATIAHELSHLLYDPDEYLNTVRVDTYEGLAYPYDVTPDSGEDWKGVENFAVDFFPISSTPFTRRGRFARLVVEACKNGLISTESAAEYLCCTVDDFQSRSHLIA